MTKMRGVLSRVSILTILNVLMLSLRSMIPNIVRLRAMAVGPNSLLIAKHAEREAVENILELQPIRSLANAKELMEQNDLI
jgi:hypothetical protein